MTAAEIVEAPNAAAPPEELSAAAAAIPEKKEERKAWADIENERPGDSVEALPGLPTPQPAPRKIIAPKVAPFAAQGRPGPDTGGRSPGADQGREGAQGLAPGTL